MSQSELLKLAHEKLHWPDPRQILEPIGAGPSVYARIAQEKLGRNISTLPDGAGVKVGVLAANPDGEATEAPIAIVCDFQSPVSEETLRQTYQLAWSFSRSPSLITSEPDRLRIWTCYEKPPAEFKISDRIVEVSRTELESLNHSSASQHTATTLRLGWAGLVSGQFFQDNYKRFQKSCSADQMLLRNLKSVRQQLKKLELDYDTIHDLLARIIFIQFLFDRKDSKGNPAFSRELLEDLYSQGELSNIYSNLSDILRNYRDTYKLFRWLNKKFNGDLFPSKRDTWQAEERKVTQEHLSLLAEFVSGELEMESGQQCLWPQYRFDVIPLDFISSIYEEFVSKESGTGIHYTPEHIVDFVLDGVLPWNSGDWNIKILDPACGSGIFLVKAFQRLIYRWEKAHPNQKIQASDLKLLLENNLFGVDVDPQAVRVVSFSLYLTMLDKFEPLDYWENDFRLTSLRSRQLITADFFQENKEGLRTDADAATYDLVIGNAPWGRNSMKKSSFVESWINRPDNQGKGRKSSYGNIGLLFLLKAAALTKLGGQVAMMQPAMPILFNQSNPAREFRETLFSEFKVEEIVNLSSLRFGLFKDAISPTCIITMTITQPDGQPLSYICPKPVLTPSDDYRIFIDPQDINIIYPHEAIKDSFIWTALMWGGRRDLALMRRLSKLENIENLKRRGVAVTRQGIIRGDKGKSQPIVVNRRILKSTRFPEDTFLFLKASTLPVNDDPLTDSAASTDLSAFNIPQMIVKQSWQSLSRRFQAAIVEVDGEENKGIVCSGSYVSVHVSSQFLPILEAACLSYNSKLAVYYLLLSSGRFASYIPEVKPDYLLRVPIPEPLPSLLQGIENVDDIDQRIREAFSFKDSEWILIEDLFNYTLPDFKGDSSSPGRERTHRIGDRLSEDCTEPELKAYCEYFGSSVHSVLNSLINKLETLAGQC